MQKTIPIHTISFNCEDRPANEFLYNLAEATGGRYHYYSDEGQSVDQPEAWEVKIFERKLIHIISLIFDNIQRLSHGMGL